MSDPNDDTTDPKRPGTQPDARPETAPESTPDPSAGVPSCPQCGGSVARVPRRWTERLRSLVSPVRRYKCRSLVCQWSGTLPHGPAEREKAAVARRALASAVD